jgi:hypothetical protein
MNLFIRTLCLRLRDRKDKNNYTHKNIASGNNQNNHSLFNHACGDSGHRNLDLHDKAVVIFYCFL